MKFSEIMDPALADEIEALERSLRENASAGATSAASIATGTGTVGGLGIGFSPNGDKGIYQGKPKKKGKPNVIRR